MATSFRFYTDSTLTLTAPSLLSFVANVDGSTGPVTKTLYFGSTDNTKVAKDPTNPGTDPIVIKVTSSSPTGLPVTYVKLAMGAGPNWAAAPVGQLSLPTQILGGTAGAVPVSFRIEQVPANQSPVRLGSLKAAIAFIETAV